MAFSKQRFRRKRRQRGFTLVDTLTTLVIASILVTAAVPAMQDFITRNRMSIEVNTFVASLYLARSEAVKRIQNVGMCPTLDFTTCANSTAWNIGWLVYANNDGSAGFDPAAGDVILQREPSLPSRFTIDGSHSSISYNAIGQANAGNYKFCDTGNVAEGRKVEISNDGRIYVVALAVADCATSNG